MEEAVLAAIDGLGHTETTEDGEETFVAQDTCIEALKDIQRIIRRDDLEKGSAKLRLGAAEVVRRSILPLILSRSDDAEVVTAALKVLAMLTMPTSDRIAQRDAHLQVLRDHKLAMLRNDFAAVIVALLAEPLQRLQSGGMGEDRTAEDVQAVELVLALLRNLLLVPDGTGAAPTDVSSGMHDLLVRLFFEEQILDLLLILVQVCEEHRHWSLVLLDVFYLLFRRETPDSLWQDTTPLPSSSTTATMPDAAQAQPMMDTAALIASAASGSGSAAALEAAKLRLELENSKSVRTGRHPRFYRPFVVKELGSQYFLPSAPSKGPVTVVARGKRTGGGAVVSKHRVSKLPEKPTTEPHSALATRAILRQYGTQFIETAYTVLYTVVTDYVKQKETSKDVLPSDSLNRLWLIYFFTSLHLAHELEEQRKDAKYVIDISPIACAMDIASFVDIITLIEEFDSKSTSPSRMAVTTGVLALGELLRVLRIMIEQEVETTRTLGIRLALKLFHDPGLILNRVPSLVSRYNPKTRPARELDALVNTGETLLAIVQTLALSGTAIFVQSKRGLNKAKKKKKVGTEEGGNSDDVPPTEGPAAERGPTAPTLEEAPPPPAEATPDPLVPPSDPTAPTAISAEVPVELGSEPTAKPPTEPEASKGTAPEKMAGGLESSAIPTEAEAAAAAPDESRPSEKSKDGENEDEEEGGDQAQEVVESQLHYTAHLTLYCTNAVIGNYSLLLARIESLSHKTMSSITSTFTRLLTEVPGSVAFFWQLSLFRIFERLFTHCKKRAAEEEAVKLRDVVVRILHDFFEAASKDPSLYVHVFCWRTRGANREIAPASGNWDDIEAALLGGQQEEDGGKKRVRLDNETDVADSAQQATHKLPEDPLAPIFEGSEIPPAPQRPSPGALPTKRRRLRKLRSCTPSPTGSPPLTTGISRGKDGSEGDDMPDLPPESAELAPMPTFAIDDLDDIFHRDEVPPLPTPPPAESPATGPAETAPAATQGDQGKPKGDSAADEDWY